MNCCTVTRRKFTFSVNMAYLTSNLPLLEPPFRSFRCPIPTEKFVKLSCLSFQNNATYRHFSLCLCRNPLYKYSSIYLFSKSLLFLCIPMLSMESTNKHNLASSFVQPCTLPSGIPHSWNILDFDSP
jgi:hypothetical protein